MPPPLRPLLCALIALSSAFTLIPQPAGGLPIPTPQQLRYQGSMNALIHFGMATFFHDGDPGCDSQNWNGCDSNGGCNSSDPRSFNPTKLNVSNWVESFKAVGVTSAVLTAKHGCGFLAWETATTLPDGSPYRYHVPPQYPVLKNFVAAMQQNGIGYGFYYSLTNNFYLNAASHNVRPPSTLLPGQANITQAQYEAIILAQVTELWSQNGDLTEIWLDGGCGDLCDKVGALVKTTRAANAVAFNGGGGVSDHPVRWCGTEGGHPSGAPTVWSTSACDPSWCPDGSGTGAPPNASGAVWQPSGVDVTLQQGDRWFYMPGVAVHSLADLAGFYHASVGNNGHLEIDFAIDRTGNVDPVHAARYAQFGAWISACYGSPLARGALPAGATSFTLALPAGAIFDRVALEEDQSAGQLIISYTVEYQAAAGSAWTPFSAGITVGAKRIDVGAAAVSGAAAVRVTVTAGYAPPTGLTLSVFAPDGCAITASE